MKTKEQIEYQIDCILSLLLTETDKKMIEIGKAQIATMKWVLQE
jgi:hypothetical protein